MTYTYEYPRPAVTTDVVLFTIKNNALSLLLIQRANPPYQYAWALPGGFVDPAEELHEAALRELHEETGVNSVYLEQLYTFGKPGRDPRDRIISVAYYALSPYEDLEITAASDANAVDWFNYQELPALAFDHKDIIDIAHQRLVAKLEYSTLALQFMPDTFTLSELQAVYEIIFGHPLDKRNFRKKILGLDILQDTDQTRRQKQHRPAKLYRAKKRDQVDFVK